MKYRVWNPNCDEPENADSPVEAATPGDAARIVATSLDSAGLLFPDDLDGDHAELRVASWDDLSFKVIFTLESTLRWERSVDHRQRKTS
jgi:hypothetical protein